MDSQDRRADLKRLIDTLRRVTTAVQILPFIYSAISIILLAVYNIVPEVVQMILDTLFYVSPVTIVAFLLLSKLLHMCKWHKTACFLPVVPQAVSLTDYYIINLTIPEVWVANSLVIVMSALLLIAAYKVFFK